MARAFPLDYRDLRERGSVLAGSYHDPLKSVFPPDYHDPRKSALPPDYHDPLKSVFPPDSALREKRARLQDEQEQARRARRRKLFGRGRDRGPIL